MQAEQQNDVSCAPLRLAGSGFLQPEVEADDRADRRYAGSVLFVAFAAYGLIGTQRVVRTVTGPRPWALCALFVMLEAVQVYGLWIPRPDADVRGGAVVAIAALCFCGYLQYLYFAAVAAVNQRFHAGRSTSAS